MTVLLSASSSWDEAKAWIELYGGFVHPFLQFDSTNRHVIIHVPSLNQHDTVDDSRSISSSSAVLEAGTTILEVPEACLLTLHSVERDAEFGKSLFGVVHSLEKVDDGGGNNVIGNDRRNYVDNNTNLHGGLYHDAQDVILALYLAYLRERILKENDCGKQQQQQQQQQQHVQNGEEETSQPIAEYKQLSRTTTVIPQDPWRFYAPYLATLPLPLTSFTKTTTTNASSSSLSFNNNQSHPQLPRQWSTRTIQHRLAGTSLYKRVLNEQRGIQTEYELVKQVWMSKHSSQHHSTTNLPLFPTFENYDTMMAMVTSRGFADLGYDGVDALVPILDLLDHSRGGRGNENVGGDDEGDNVGRKDNATEISRSRREGNDVSIQHRGECLTRSSYDDIRSEDEQRRVEVGNIVQQVEYPILQSSRVGPDVRYTRCYEEEEDDDDDSETLNKDKKNEGPLSKRLKTTDESIQRRVGGVRVTTSRSIPPGSILQMTYGAKGNAVLLGRYGFCIPNNVEPDGSCNDVLEIEIKSNAQPVKFQRGPKSYAYGPFVHALELCYDADGRHVVSTGDGTIAAAVDGDRRIGLDDGDLEDFLDSCDNEVTDEEVPTNEGDNEDCDSGDADNDFGDTDTSYSRYTSMVNDIRAIDVLEDILLKVKSGLVNSSLATLMCKINHDRHGDVVDEADRYCSILIHSEIQTIDFFLAVGIECRHRLAEHVRKLPSLKESRKAMENRLKIEYEVVNDIIYTESMREQVIGIANAFAAIRYSL